MRAHLALLLHELADDRLRLTHLSHGEGPHLPSQHSSLVSSSGITVCKHALLGSTHSEQNWKPNIRRYKWQSIGFRVSEPC